MPYLENSFSWFAKLSTKEKAIYGVLLILSVVYILIETRRGSDFICYLDAAQKLLNGQNIYEPPFQTSRYLYHPLWATLLIPVLGLPHHLLVFIWNALNVFLFLRVIFMLQTYFEVRLDNHKLNICMWVLILLCATRFLQYNFMYGQMTVFLLWAMLETVYLSAHQKQYSAGVLLGFAAIVKILPVVLLPYFLFRKKFKMAAVAGVSAAFFFFLPMLVTGHKRFYDIIRYWFFTLQPDSAELGSDNQSFYPQNLSALLFRFLTETNAPYSNNILNLTYPVATWVVNIILLVFVLFTLYFLSTSPFKNALSVKHELYELSYILLICPLIFPHQQKYAFLLTLPAIACLMLFVFEKKAKKEKNFLFYFISVCLSLNFILVTLTSDLFIGQHLSAITQHLKTITLGTLLLIPALASCKKYFVRGG